MTTSTRERIVAESLRLFADRGYAATSVAEIEAAAGLSPGAGGLYRHFRSKEEVLAAIRPESLELSTTGWGNRPNEWPGTVTNRAFLGEAVDHIVRVGGLSLRVRGNPSVSIKPGTDIFVATEPSKVTLVPVG